MIRAVLVAAIGFGGGLMLSLAWRLPAAEADQSTGAALAGQAKAEAREQQSDAPDDSPEIDPLSVNAACYVCHMTFIREELSKVHFKQKVTCIECHGLSAGHANDEDIGATPPDMTFKRKEVDASCGKCHQEHDVPARKVIARWLKRGRPPLPAICTDCHGAHKIERPDQNEPDKPCSTKEQPLPAQKSTQST